MPGTSRSDPSKRQQSMTIRGEVGRAQRSAGILANPGQGVASTKRSAPSRQASALDARVTPAGSPPPEPADEPATYPGSYALTGSPRLASASASRKPAASSTTSVPGL